MIGKRSLGVAVAVLLMMSCAQTDDAAEEQPADTATMSTEAPAAAPAGDPNGTWDMRSVPVGGTDTVPTIYKLQVANGVWTLLFPNREPIVGKVVADADSFIVDAGPYKSVRREGKTVSTHSVYRINGDQMTGTVVATYEGNPEPLHLTSTGTRVQQ